MAITEAQYKLAKDQAREKAVKADKKRIDEALSSNDETKLKATHMDIDGKYGAYVLDWGKSMYAYGTDLGFDYEPIHNKEDAERAITYFLDKNAHDRPEGGRA